MSRDQLKAQLQRQEEYRFKLYRDTVGKTTGGFGHNFDAKGVSRTVAAFILDEDIADAEKEAATFPWFVAIDSTRQDVVINMIFNLGLEKFSEFKHMISFLAAGKYFEAADEMLRSAWYHEVGNRAVELAMIMESGQYVKMPGG